MEKLVEIKFNNEVHFIDMTHIVFIILDRGVVFIKYDYEEDKGGIEPFFMGEETKATELFTEIKTNFKNYVNKYIEKGSIILNTNKIVNIYFSDYTDGTYWSIDFSGEYSVQRLTADTIIELLGEDIIEFKPTDFKEAFNE